MMKNLAKNLTEKAAILGLSALSLTANAKEAGKEYNNLDFEIKTELTTFKAQTAIANQTYDATAFFKNPPKTFVGASAKFSKSREKNETDPLTPTEIKKRLDEGKKIIALLGNLKGDELIKKMQDEGITIEYLRDLADKIEMVRQYFMTYKNKAINKMYLIEQGSRGSYEESKDDRDKNQKWEDIADKIEDNIYDIIINAEKHLAQKEITDAKEKNGVVTDYTKIAGNPKLAEVIDKLHITFKKDSKGRVEVYVNGERAYFRLFKPEKTESYEIFSDAENIGVIFVVKSKDGSVYQEKYILKGDTVFNFSRHGDKNEWNPEKTFKVPVNQNPAKKTLTMND